MENQPIQVHENSQNDWEVAFEGQDWISKLPASFPMIPYSPQSIGICIHKYKEIK